MDNCVVLDRFLVKRNTMIAFLSIALFFFKVQINIKMSFFFIFTKTRNVGNHNVLNYKT